MAKVLVYHNPRCITCRRSIEVLRTGGVDFELRDFFKDRMGKDEIRSLLKKAGISAREALRKKDKMYGELKLGEKEHSEEQLIGFMSKYPGLIARPIFVRGGECVIANNPEIAKTFSRSKP